MLGSIDTHDPFVLQRRVALYRVGVNVAASLPGLRLHGAPPDLVPPLLQQDATAHAVRLDLVIEAVCVSVFVSHMEAPLVDPTEQPPDLGLASDEVAVRLEIPALALLVGEAEFDQ